MTKEEEIISITEATVAAYSNSPVWYKSSIIKYMNEFAKEQTTSLKAEVERLEGVLRIGNKTQKIHELKKIIDVLKKRGINDVSRIEHLQKEIEENKKVIDHYNDTVLSLQSQLAEKDMDIKAIVVNRDYWQNESYNKSNELAKAEADKQELLEFIKACKEYLSNTNLIDKSYIIINKHGNNK